MWQLTKEPQSVFYIQNYDLLLLVIISLNINTKYVTLLSCILERSPALKLYLGQNLSLDLGPWKSYFFLSNGDSHTYDVELKSTLNGINYEITLSSRVSDNKYTCLSTCLYLWILI